MADPFDLDFIPVPKEDDRPFLTRLADYLKGGGWQDPQPGQRGSWLPSKVDENLKASPAVPKIAEDAANDWWTFMDDWYSGRMSNAVRSGDRDAIDSLTERSFNIASMLPAAGVAAGRMRQAPQKGVDLGITHTVLDHAYDRQPYQQDWMRVPGVRRIDGGSVYSNPDDPTTAAATAALTAQERPQGIKAYHGSPHDFDRFDLSKIGTGEGAQAYGHGLYFAENEGVARSYRDTLAGFKFPDGSAFDDANPAHQAAAYIAGTKSKAEAIAALNDDIAMSKRQNDGAHAQRLMRAKGMLERGEAIPELKKGRMYEVRINADPADFLDWDKPLSQQSEKVRQATSRLGMSPDASGEGIIAALERRAIEAGGQESMGTVRQATDPLREAGIPGIKYLDQGSRTAGDGSRNYVVFDDALVEILRKYANAPDPTTAAILALLTAQQGGPPQQ